MPYVRRDSNMKIVGLYSTPQYESQEFITDDHTDISVYKEQFIVPTIDDKIDALIEAQVNPQAILDAAVAKTRMKRSL